MRLGARRRPDRLRSPTRRRRPARRRRLEMELAADDARDVEEVFDEPRLRAGVAIDAFERPRVCSGAGRAVSEDLQPAEDRVQRRAQFVRQRREEFVLQAARPAQLVVGGRQPPVAPLDLLDHAVERVDERPDFVVACLRRAQRVVAAVRDARRRVGQAAQRRQDDAFQAAGDDDRRQQAEDDADDRGQSPAMRIRSISSSRLPRTNIVPTRLPPTRIGCDTATARFISCCAGFRRRGRAVQVGGRSRRT